jgi:phage portal protein BeeE
VYDADDVAVRGSTGAKAAGKSVRLSSYDVLHIPGIVFDGLVEYSPIAMAKNAIGMAIACEE